MAENKQSDFLLPLKSKNIVWSEYKIAKEDRARRNGHKSAVIWLTGLSGSGKSTIANALDCALYEAGCQSYVLDGDNIRHGLNDNLGFSQKDRSENIRRIAEVARLFAEAGFIIITAFISPYLKDRQRAREVIGRDQFIECFVDAPLEICRERDPKGLYQKAIHGEIKEFTGISAPYEKPVQPDIVLDTSSETIELNTRQIINYLSLKLIVSEEISA